MKTVEEGREFVNNITKHTLELNNKLTRGGPMSAEQTTLVATANILAVIADLLVDIKEILLSKERPA